MEIRDAHTTGKSGNLGSFPCDGEEDGSIAEDAEIVCIVGVLPDVLAGEDQIFPSRLLHPSVEFIAPSGSERRRICRGTAEKRIQHQAVASDAGDDQVLVERRFEHARVRNTQHGVALLYVVSDADARLGLFVGGQAVIEIPAQANVECPVPFGDLILHVKRELLDVGMAAEGKQTSSAGQIKGREIWIEGGTCGIVERGINNPEFVALVEERLLIRGPRLYVVYTLHVRHVRAQAGIRQASVLSDRLLLNRGKIVEQIGTGIVVVLVSPNEGTQREYRGVTEQPSPGGSNIK